MGRSERLFDSLARTKGSTDEQFFNLNRFFGLSLVDSLKRKGLSHF